MPQVLAVLLLQRWRHWKITSILWPGENGLDKDSMKYTSGIRLSVWAGEHKPFPVSLLGWRAGVEQRGTCDDNYEI